MQRLICEEIHKANENACLSIDGVYSGSCTCDFFNKYMLPCQHMFLSHHRGIDRLDDETLNEMVADFAESGFDAYYAWEGVQTEQQLKLTEEEKRFNDFYYSFNETIEDIRNDAYAASKRNFSEALSFQKELAEFRRNWVWKPTNSKFIRIQERHPCPSAIG